MACRRPQGTLSARKDFKIVVYIVHLLEDGYPTPCPHRVPPYIQLQKYNRHRQFSTWFVTTICHLILPLSFITYLFLFFLYSFVCSCFIRSFFAVVLASCRVPCCATSCPSLVPRCCPCYCQCWYYRLALSSHPAPHLTILLVYVQRCNGGDWYGVPI